MREEPKLQVSQREKRTEAYGSLGPDDLMVITKEKINTKKPEIENVFQYISGIFFDSISSFTKYVDELESYQNIQNNQSSNKYKIVNVVCNCYNSFRQEDITFERIGNIDQLLTPNFNSQELRCSCALRYYRINYPVYLFIFGGSTMTTNNIIHFPPPPITYDDIKFILENHKIDNSILFSLSRMISLLHSTREASSIFHQFGNKYPQLYSYIWNIIPKTSQLFTALSYFIDTHITNYYDDIILIQLHFNNLLQTKEIQKCKKFVPILFSSIWDFPLSPILLSKLCILQAQYEEAIQFLNIASYSNGWPMHHKFDLFSKQEIRISKSPIFGIYSEYLTTIINLINLIGNEKFKELMNVNKNEQNITNENINKNLNHYNKLNIINDNNNNNKNEKYFLLVDEGIEQEPILSYDLNNIPLSKFFNDVITTANSIIFRYQKLKDKKIQFTNDGLWNIIVAYRMSDGILLMNIFDKLCAIKMISVYECLIVAKAMIDGIIKWNEKIVNIKINNCTTYQRNMLNYICNLVEKLMELPK